MDQAACHALSASLTCPASIAARPSAKNRSAADFSTSLRSGDLGDNLLTVGGATLADDVLAEAVADLPVEPDELTVEGTGGSPAGLVDKAMQLADESGRDGGDRGAHGPGT